MGYFTDYPKHVFLILSNEFCERFSYYGMKSILTTYFRFALKFSESTSIALYHSFSCLCYFTPLLGAMIADGWLGKFRTIFYLSIVYALGNVVMTVTAIPIDGSWISWTPFIGLVIIAFGTGGIKPCVSSFGGDQFKPHQVRQKESFFSLFYMAINIGGLLSTIITPLIRQNVECFGQECYAVAFGIPAALMVVSIFVFVIGSRWYTKVPPGESIIIRLFGCIGTAIKGKCGCCSKGPKEKKDHWLDYAEPKYDKRFIADVKDVMSVAWLFLPLPIFWSLFDQQGSRWTLQAFSMKNDFGGFVMPPDMMQVMNALLVVIFVPILESLIYPCLTKLHIPNRPLQRMGLGMVFAGTAFLVAGFLQIAIDNESPNQVSGTTQVRYNFLNTGPCEVAVNDFTVIDGNVAGLKINPHSNTGYFYEDQTKLKDFNFTATCGNGVQSVFTLPMTGFQPGTAYQIVLTPASVSLFEQYINDFTLDLEASFRVYNALDEVVSVKIVQKDSILWNNTQPGNFTEYMQSSDLDKYELLVTNADGKNFTITNSGFDILNGALYTLLIYHDAQATATGQINAVQLTEVVPRGINIFLQVPQYVIMTLAECLISVTGLGFAYSQAAPSMKSILTSIWLLTVAIGNVVVVVVEEAGTGLDAMTEFFLFTGLMYGTTVIFVIMAYFYKYVEPRSEPPSDTASTSSIESSMSGDSDIKKEKKMAEIVEDNEVVLKKVDDVNEDAVATSSSDRSSRRSSVRSNGSDTHF